MPVNESYDKEINKRTKELSKRPVSNKRGEVLQQQQEVQNQLQVIQNERRNNLLSQKTESNAQDQTNQLLNQAAELGVGGATAATLKKYGIQGGPTVNRRHTQSREVRTTPSKITIINNNNTTNTTNTKVDGGVGGNNSDSSGKFKSWLTKVNAQQQEASARRDRDYARRESDLTRSANKMLRKVESIGKGIVETFNPQQFGQSVGGQLKMFLLIFGMRFLAKYWDQVIDGVKWIGDAVENVGGFFGVGKKGKEFAARGTGFLPTLVKLFGGDPKKENVAQAIGNSVSSALDHFGLKLEHMMEIRGAAIGKVKFQMPKSKGALGGVLKSTGIDTFFADTFSAVTKYLGDIFTALVNPEKGLKNTINGEMNKVADSGIKAAQARDSSKSRTATIAPGISQGDYAAFNTKGGRRYSLLEGSVNAGGQLTGNKAGQVSQSMDILGVFRDARMTGKVDTARLLTGLQRLQDGARRGGTVAVDPEFITAMFDQATLRNLIGSKHIIPKQYKFVVDKKSAYERGQEIGNPVVNGMGIGYKVGKSIGKSIGLNIPIISDVAGFNVGLLGAGTGGVVGGGVYYAKDAMTNDYTLRLVPIDDPRPPVQKRTTQVFEIDETAVRAIARKYGAKGFDYADERLVSALQNSIYQRAGGYSAVRSRWHGKGSNETYNIRRGYSRVDEFSRMRQRHRIEDENDEFSRRHQRAMGTIKGIGNSVIDAGMSVYNGAMDLIEPGKGNMRTSYNPSTGQYYGTGYPGGSSSSSPTYYTPQSSSTSQNYSRATYTTVTYQSTGGNGGNQKTSGARTWGNPLTPTSTELSFNVEVAAQECLRLSTFAIYNKRGENPQPWRKKPGTQSTGGSSGHVRRAIAKGLGLNTLSNHPQKAKDYVNFLYLYGFAPVPWSSYVPRKGDINICGPTPNHRFGHICLNCGNAWVSDYVQRDMWGDAEFRNNKYATVLRHIRCTGSLGDNSIGPDLAESGNSSGYIDFNGDGKYDAFQDSEGKVYELDSSGNLGKELDVNTVNSQVNSSSTFTSTNTNYQSIYSSNYASYSSNPPSSSYNSSSYTPTYTPTYGSTPTTPTVRSSGGGVSSKSDFSGLVTNPLMKKVLSDCGHLDSNTLGKGYTLTRTYHHCCTSGPTTWYKKAGIQLRWWRSPKTATVEEMKRNLQAAGMVPVWHGTGQEANAKLNSSQYLRPGDIASMLSSNSSHGVMWTGEDWRSDALQGSKPYPYSSKGRGGDWTFILWRHPALQESNIGVMGEGFSGGDNYYIGGGGSSYFGGGSMGIPSYSSSGSYGGGSYYSGGISSGPVAYTGAGMGTSNYVAAPGVAGMNYLAPGSIGGGINLNDPMVQAAINHTGGYSKGQKAEYIRDAYLAFRAAGMSHVVAVASIAQDIQEAGFGSSAVARLGNNYSGISAMPKRGILPYRPGGRWGGFQNLGHYAREKKALLDRLYPGATTAQSPEEYMRAIQGVDANGNPIKGRYAWCATETYGGVSSDRFKYINHVLGNVNTVNSLISTNADLSRLLNSGGQLPQGMPMLGGGGLKPGFNLGYGNVLMVGDSWGVGMKKYFTQNTAVGSTGLFSRNGRPDLPSVTDQINAANYSNGVIIVHSGGNDIALRAKSGGQAAVQEDVRRAVAAAAAKGNKVIFVAAPWMNHSSKSITGNRDKYNEWLRNAVLSSGAGFIDTNPIMDYMKQHQPRYGQFHLDDYSGYARFILQEAQKQVNGTGAQIGIPQMQQMQQSPMPIQPMQVQQVVSNATRNLKAERLALDKEMRELEKAKRELEKERNILNKDKLEKDIKRLEAERDRLEKEAEKLEKRLKDKGIEEKEKEEIKDRIEEIDTKEDKLDEELEKLEEQKKKAEEGGYEKRKRELEEKEKDLKRRKEDLDKAEKAEEKQQLEKVMEKSEYTFFGHMTNLEKKVSAMGSKSFAMSVWSLHPSLQAKWNAIGGFDVWYKNEFSKLSPKKQAQYAVELESEDVIQATSSKDILFQESKYYDPVTNTYKTTDILQDSGVTNGLSKLLNSDYKRDENGNIIVDSSGNPTKQHIYVPDAGMQPEEFQKFFKAYYTSLSPEKRELLSSLLAEERIRHDFDNEMHNDYIIASNIDNHDFLDRNYGAHDDGTKKKVEKELREKYGLTTKNKYGNYISPFALLGYREKGDPQTKRTFRRIIGNTLSEQIKLVDLVREGDIGEFTKKIEESSAYKDYYKGANGRGVIINPLAVNLAEGANDDIYFDPEENKYYTNKIGKNGKEEKKYVLQGDYFKRGGEKMTKRDFEKKLLLASLFASDEFEKYQEQIDKLIPTINISPGKSNSYENFAKSTSAAYEIAKLQNIQANLTTGFESINDSDDIRTKLQKEERNRSRAKWNAIIAKKQSEYNNWEMDTWSLLQQDPEAKQKFTNKYGVGKAAMKIYLNSKEGTEARDAAFKDMILAMREKQLMESGGDKPFADEFVQFAKALHYKDFNYLTEGGLSEKADLAKSISLTRDEKRAKLEETHKYLDQKAFADLMAQQGNKEYKEADDAKKKMMQDDYNTKIAKEIEEELHKQTQEHVQTIIDAAANKKFNEAEVTAALEHIGLGDLVTRDQIKGAKSGEQIFKEVKDEEGNWHYYGMDGKEILVEDRDANGKKIKRTLKTEERDKYYSGLDKAGVTGYRYANVKDSSSGKEEQLKIVGRTKDGKDVVQSSKGLSILERDKEGKLYASGVSNDELYNRMVGTKFGYFLPQSVRDTWLKQQFEEEGKRSYAYRQLQDWRDQVLDKNGPGYGIAGYNLKDEVKWTDEKGKEHRGNVNIDIHEESLEDYKKRDAVVRGDMTAEEAMLDNISTMLGRRLSEEEKGTFLEQARANDGKVSFADITIPGTNGKKAFAVKKANGDMQIIPDNSVLSDLYKGDQKLAKQQGFDSVTAKQYAEQRHLERMELSRVQSRIASKQLTVEGANVESLKGIHTEVSLIARKMDAIPTTFNNDQEGGVGSLFSYVKSVLTPIIVQLRGTSK